MSNHSSPAPIASYPLSKKHIPDYILEIIATIKKAGFDAYIVGGSIRDILHNRPVKDFDIATNGKEEDIAKLFEKVRIVGRRFRVVYLYHNNNLVEITTFRKTPSKQAQSKLILKDNTHGNIREDAFRRDFTFNSLYFDTDKELILDYTSGFKDAQSNTLRCIGKAKQRFLEDPVRMLRALRFATKLQSKISLNTKYHIKSQSCKICTASSARLFDELIKNLLSGYAHDGYLALKKYGFIKHLLPHTDRAIKKYPVCEKILISALKNTDQRIREKKSVTPAFLYAALLYPDVYQMQQSYIKEGKSSYIALTQAVKRSQHHALEQLVIPKYFFDRIRNIFLLQYPLEKPSEKNKSILSKPPFRAAYDFLKLRSYHQPSLVHTVQWWHQAQKNSNMPSHKKSRRKSK